MTFLLTIPIYCDVDHRNYPRIGIIFYRLQGCGFYGDRYFTGYFIGVFFNLLDGVSLLKILYCSVYFYTESLECSGLYGTAIIGRALMGVSDKE